MKDPKRQISGSQPQNLNHTSDAQEVQTGESEMTYVEREIRTLAKVKGLEPIKINLWKVAFEEVNNLRTTLENQIYKSEEETRSVKNEIYRIYKSEEEICCVKNEIYQVVGFFSAFQGLLITTAAQSNLLRCNNAGFVLALSAFATAVAVFGLCKRTRSSQTCGEAQALTNRNKHYMKVNTLVLQYDEIVDTVERGVEKDLCRSEDVKI